MKSDRNITRGGLSGKLGGYQPDPPASVWEGVASGLRGKRSNRKIFLILGAAAGFALAITVGISLLNKPLQPGVVLLEESSPGKSSPAVSEDPIAAQDESVVADEESVVAGDESVVAGDLSVAADDESIVADDVSQGPNIEPSAGKLQAASETVLIAGKEQPGNVQPEKEQPGIVQPENVQPENVQPENVTHLEQKVITAMQEVMEEQLAENEKRAQQSESDQTGTGMVDADQAGIQPQLQADNDHEQQEANEDSLIRLLEADERVLAGRESADSRERKNGKWQLGATLSPLISYRDVASGDAAQNIAVNNSESARLTYAGGLGVSYLPTERLTIQTGIYYNKLGVNIGDYSSFKSGWFESEMDMVSAPSRSESVVGISNSMGTVISSEEERFVNNYAGAGTLTDYHLLTPDEMVVADASVESFIQTFEYLEIPFNVRYKILDRTIDLQLMGGFSTNLLVNNAVAAIAGDQSVAIGKVQDIRAFNYSGNAGVGVVYELFENFSLSVEPRFRYYLNSINTDNLPVTRPYTFGFYTGLNYKF